MISRDALKPAWRNAVNSHCVQVQKKLDSEKDGQKVWATMLYGSQNYGLETEKSDVDTRSLILPNLYSVAKNTKLISTEFKMLDGSLDTAKDLREMFANYLKSNISFLETLYTPYYVVMDGVGEYQKFFQELRDHRDLIANARPRSTLHMAVGMAELKYRDFNKFFTGKKEVLDQYGYDPKQLHHQVRLYHFISTFIKTGDFKSALESCHPSVNPERYEEVMALKIDPLSYDDADSLRNETRKKIFDLEPVMNTLVPKGRDFDGAKEFLDDLSYRVICYTLKRELEAAYE